LNFPLTQEILFMKSVYFIVLLVLLISCSNDDTATPPVVLPVASFSSDTVNINQGDLVRFSNTSTEATSYAWTFEGGSPSTNSQENPVIAYTNPGTFDVTLISSNSNGSDTITVENYITVNAVTSPTASFTTSETNIDSFRSVTFIDTSDNDPTNWEWSFPGGNPSSSTNPNETVRYEQPGTFDVSLTVSNPGGTSTETLVGHIEVNVREKIYEVTFTGNWTVENHPVSFPNNDHFSRAVGMIHNESASLFVEGGLASNGIELSPRNLSIG